MPVMICARRGGSEVMPDMDATPTPARARSTWRQWGWIVAGVAAVILLIGLATPLLVVTGGRLIANRALDAGQPAAAEPWLRFALRLHTRSADLHDSLGTVLFAEGRTAEALDHFKQAVGLDSSLASAQNNLGTALLNLQQPAAAIPYLQAAVTLNPGQTTAFANLGHAYYRVGQLDAALTAYQRAFELDATQVDARAQWGAIMFEWGDLQQAAKAWQTVLTRDSQHLAARRGLGAVAALQGRALDAVKLLTRVTQDAPSDPLAAFYLGLAYRDLARFDDAAAAFEKTAANSQDNRLTRLARMQLLAVYAQSASDQDARGGESNESQSP
jgi:tetratricopeptide (TPR) repeat protein